MLGLLFGGVVGVPLRAEDAPPSVSFADGTDSDAARKDSAARKSGIQFVNPGHETSKRRRSRSKLLTIGNGPSQNSASEAPQSVGQTSTPSGIQIDGGPVSPRQSEGRLELRSTSRDVALPTESQFEFQDKRSPALRRNEGAGLLSVTIDGTQPATHTVDAHKTSSGFSFADTAKQSPAAIRKSVPGEPTLARDVSTPASHSTHPLAVSPLDILTIPAEAAVPSTDGVLMTIRQRSDGATAPAETTTDRVAPTLAEQMPGLPQWVPQSVAPPRTEREGVVSVSNFEPQTNDPSTHTAEFNRPVGASESIAAEAMAAPALPMTTDTDASHQVPVGDAAVISPQWSRMPDHDQVAEDHQSLPIDWDFPSRNEPSGDTAWWTTEQSDTSNSNDTNDVSPMPSAEMELNAWLGFAAGQLLLPVELSTLDIPDPKLLDETVVTETPTPKAPALLSQAAEQLLQAPLTREFETPYTGAVKPAGAATLPKTGDTYTMGPGRGSHPLPPALSVDEVKQQPQPEMEWPATGNIISPSNEVAALLDDLDPLVPGVPRRSGGAEANSPTSADFPSTNRDATSDAAATSGAADVGTSAAEQTLGEAPEETNEPLQFLRRQTVLLEPGEHQFDVGLSYLNDTSDFPVLLSDDMGVVRGETRQRLLSVPLELRVGIAPYTQAFLNVPFGWSNSEVSFNGSEFTEDDGGIGDVSAGVTKQIVMGNEYYPDVLASLAFSAPTGDSSITTALGVPGSSLGQGFWTLTGGLSFIQTYDPLVFFYGVGYTFRFQNEFGDNIEVEPGDQVFYRFGAGFAVNPHVTLSAAFTGSVLGRDKVEGIEVGGSVREPMSIRLAATISRRKGSKTHSSFKLVEPYVNFGLNEDSIDSLIGISWTH